MYILVIDDDQFANALVQFVLSKEGYEVETTDNPRGAMQMIQKREPDLLIIDAAQDAIESKLQGFNIGADDYICKPFNHQELVARVQAVMRRIKKDGKMGNTSIRCGQIELLPGELKVVIPEHASIPLTPTEMQVLRVLMTSSGQVVNRDQLLSEVWNDNESNSNIVDVYIRRLRLKLEEDAESPKHITSVRGIGYKFLGK